MSVPVLVSFLIMLCGAFFNLIGFKHGPCVFCNVSRGNGFDVVMEDSKYVMFMDIRPAAAWHYLVIPKVHIGSVRDLGVEDIELVQGMLAMGESYFDSEQIPRGARRFGFHIPPFNSVDHLHLHCFGLPFRSTLKSRKYPVSRRKGPRYTKGWGWFIEADQVIHTLRNGGRVRVSPC